MEAKRRELEAKRAQQASKAEKQFYKVTVTVREGERGSLNMPAGSGD